MQQKKKNPMNYITRERVYRFSNEDYSRTTWAMFLYRYFPKKQVDVILRDYNVRIDTKVFLSRRLWSDSSFQKH